MHDKELRYRKRWLDLISNQEVKDVFLKRSQIFRVLRSFMEDNEFIEVETPILGSVYGGAEARPFETKLNALNQEMFMRISLEPALKKLIVAALSASMRSGSAFAMKGSTAATTPNSP